MFAKTRAAVYIGQMLYLGQIRDQDKERHAVSYAYIVFVKSFLMAATPTFFTIFQFFSGWCCDPEFFRKRIISSKNPLME